MNANNHIHAYKDFRITRRRKIFGKHRSKLAICEMPSGQEKVTQIIILVEYNKKYQKSLYSHPAQTVLVSNTETSAQVSHTVASMLTTF